MCFKSPTFLLKKAIVLACVVVGVGGITTPSWGFSVLGPGWDGPGLGSASLTYHLGTLTADLSATTVKSTLETAMDVWSAVADITFTETFSAGLSASLDFEFTTGSHGDGFPFDGPGGVLAHAFYPSPPNPEPIAGDVHFDDAELWEVGNGLGGAAFDLMWVAVHEIGHALGLAHSDVAGAVMFPSVSSSTVFTGLQPDDITGIDSLYAPAPVLPNPEPTSIVLLGTGFLGLLGYGRYHRKQTA